MRIRTGPIALAAAMACPALLFPAVAATQAAPAHRTSLTVYHPYTAEFKITQVQTLANGVTITRESTEIHAVDSQGRSVSSTTELPPTADQQPFTRVHVYNRADGTQTNWDTRNKQVRILKAPVGEQRQGCWETDSGGTHMSFNGAQTRAASDRAAASAGPAMERAAPATEELGTTTIQGVEARGTRTTWTTPAGRIGNDAPLVRVSESWWSTTLGLLLREVSDDPRSGKYDRELVSIDQGEPAASAFQPPDGYEVVTEEMHEVPCQH